MLHDTAIYDQDFWVNLVELSTQIENEYDIAVRLVTRIERINVFLDYLIQIEKNNLLRLNNLNYLKHFDKVKIEVNQQMEEGLRRAKKRYGEKNG
jgi:hypothetical protein